MQISELRDEVIVEIDKFIDRYEAAAQVVSTKQNDDGKRIWMQQFGGEAIKDIAVSIVQAVICKPAIHPALWHRSCGCNRVPQQHHIGAARCSTDKSRAINLELRDPLRERLGAMGTFALERSSHKSMHAKYLLVEVI